MSDLAPASVETESAAGPVCRVRDLRVAIRTPGEAVEIVCGVSFDLHAGRTTALVGESGSGKSMTGLAMLGLLPRGALRAGQILLAGRDLAALPESDMRQVRGDRVAVVFQEPMTALNPVLSIGQQVAEPLCIHRKTSRRAAEAAAIEMLGRVGLPDPRRVAGQYPHQLSGGMRQRVCIAMALICHPDVLIADEPTTALDATTQLQILDLLRQLQTDFGMAVLLITHDLSLVRQRADWIEIMYAGRLVEQGPAGEILRHAAHPYTAALLEVAPDLARPRGGRLPVIAGDVPQPYDRPPGCAFHPRCETGRDLPQCRSETPEIGPAGQGHRWACWHPRSRG